MIWMVIVGALLIILPVIFAPFVPSDGEIESAYIVGAAIVAVIGLVLVFGGCLYESEATKESDVGIETTISESEAVTEVYTIADIIKSEDNYIVISNDDKVVIIPQNKVTMNISEKEMVIAEKNDETVTKATFLITKERMLSLIEMD